MKHVQILSAIISICADNALEAVFVNNSGEIFTIENLASLSVAGDKTKYKLMTLAEAKAALAAAEKTEKSTQKVSAKTKEQKPEAPSESKEEGEGSGATDPPEPKATTTKKATAKN